VAEDAEPTPTAAPQDVFGEAAFQRVVSSGSLRTATTRRREPPRPTPARLATAALIAAVLAYLFDMPLTWQSWVTIGGFPFPAGAVFVVGVVAIHAVRARRTLQVMLFPPVAALFFAIGLPLIVTPFAPLVRYVFFLVLIGSAVALYEWVMPPA
jgi:hypothetical protein